MLWVEVRLREGGEGRTREEGGELREVEEAALDLGGRGRWGRGMGGVIVLRRWM